MISKHSAVELRGACNVGILKEPIILLPAKGFELDEILGKVNGIQFFFSSVTAVETNAKKPKENNNSEPDVYPAIAYFVVFRETDTCNKNAIFTLFHNEDTHATIQTTRGNKDSNTQIEHASRQLFQVVKDHNNRGIIAMLNASNDYYLRNCDASTLKEQDHNTPVRNRPPRYPTCPCVLVVVNCS